MAFQDQFYLRSRHGDCGNSVMFHALNGRGYTTDLAKAHVFTREEATKEWGFEEKSVPLSKPHVDDLAETRVDMQYIESIPHDEISMDCDKSYFICLSGKYDGNDLFFLSKPAHQKRWTNDFTKAMTLPGGALVRNQLEVAGMFGNSDFHVLECEHTKSICRQTFQRQNVNLRKMTTCAGIKKPKWKRYKVQRYNCNKCGRFISEEHFYAGGHYDLCDSASCSHCE